MRLLDLRLPDLRLPDLHLLDLRLPDLRFLEVLLLPPDCDDPSEDGLISPDSKSGVSEPRERKSTSEDKVGVTCILSSTPPSLRELLNFSKFSTVLEAITHLPKNLI